MTSKVDVFGAEHIRNKGAFVVPNKLSAEDVIQLEGIIGAARITYVLSETESPSEEMNRLFSRPGLDGIVLSPNDPDPAALGEKLRHSLEEGRVLLFVPGAVTVYRGTLTNIPIQTLDFLCRLDVPVTPLFVGHYGETGEVSHRDTVLRTVLDFRPALDQSGLDALPFLRQAWNAGSEAGMSSLPFLKGSLASAVVRGMKAHPHARVIDGIDDSSLPNHILLGAAIAFSKRLKELTSRRRIGIILPPGKGATLANLACLLAGKIPVNINFTASAEAVESSIRQAEVDRFITADPFVRKLPDFPWPPMRDLILLERERMSFQKSAKKWVILARFLPASALIRLLDLDSSGDDDEAVLLFTSGSSGAPKGVPLTHRNILGNIAQCRSRIDLTPDSRLLGCLPIFHSFGCTITLWFPLVFGYDVVTYPSPKEARRLGELVEQYAVDLVVTTPTFMRGIIKRVPSKSLASVKYLIAGAEKLSPDLAESFKSKFGFYPVEGYGLTETSPVCCVNMPTPPVPEGSRVLASEKMGTVGQLLPGIAVKVTDPVTAEIFPMTRTGMLWLKGANVFGGYLNQEKLNREILVDGWFCTGDVGRMDPEGFLHIEGRISRFSKIGGEMVPHEQLEIAILRAMSLDPTDSERHVAVVSVPDKQKGEAIVLLTTVVGPSVYQDLMVLRYKLMDLGIPSLWCPKYLLPVKSIPIFTSGKLDIPQCEAIVKEARESGNL